MKQLKFVKTAALLVALGIAGGLTVRAEQNDSSRNHNTSSTTSTSSTESGRLSAPGHQAQATDQQIKEAAQMNLAATKAAELAEQKAQNPQLKQFANTLVRDHQQAQKDLERIAQKQNVTLPTTLDSKCQEQMSHLQGLSGSEFDREFAKQAIEGHAMALAKLQQSGSESGGASSAGLSGRSSTSSTTSSSQNSTSSGLGSSAQSTTGSGASDLQQYNQRMLAKVKEHQQTARQVARAVGLEQSEISSLESKDQEGVGSPASQSSGQSSSSDRESSRSPNGNNSSSTSNSTPNEGSSSANKTGSNSRSNSQ